MIKLYTQNEAATRRKIAKVAALYDIKPRIHRITHKPTVNLSATIDKALDVALAAAQTAQEEQGK